MKIVTVLAASAVLLAAAPSAQASTASLRKVVSTQENKTAKAAQAFVTATKDTTSAIGRERSQTGLTAFQKAVKTLRTAVAKQQASSAGAKRGRTNYLKAVDRTSAALRTFGSGLIAFDPDAPAKAAALIKKANAQLASAQKARTAARKLIGG